MIYASESDTLLILLTLPLAFAVVRVVILGVRLVEVLRTTHYAQ